MRKLKQLELETLQLYYQGVRDYKVAKPDLQKKMVQTIETNLGDHQKALDCIGTGYAPCFVKAGLLFLRWVKIFGKYYE
jgi:hypothetical protein